METQDKEKLIEIEVKRIDSLQEQLDDVDSIARNFGWDDKKKVMAIRRWESEISKAQKVIQKVEMSY